MLARSFVRSLITPFSVLLGIAVPLASSHAGADDEFVSTNCSYTNLLGVQRVVFWTGDCVNGKAEGEGDVHVIEDGRVKYFIPYRRYGGYIMKEGKTEESLPNFESMNIGRVHNNCLGYPGNGYVRYGVDIIDSDIYIAGIQKYFFEHMVSIVEDECKGNLKGVHLYITEWNNRRITRNTDLYAAYNSEGKYFDKFKANTNSGYFKFLSQNVKRANLLLGKRKDQFRAMQRKKEAAAERLAAQKREEAARVAAAKELEAENQRKREESLRKQEQDRLARAEKLRREKQELALLGELSDGEVEIRCGEGATGKSKAEIAYLEVRCTEIAKKVEREEQALLAAARERAEEARAEAEMKRQAEILLKREEELRKREQERLDRNAKLRDEKRELERLRGLPDEEIEIMCGEGAAGKSNLEIGYLETRCAEMRARSKEEEKLLMAAARESAKLDAAEIKLQEQLKREEELRILSEKRRSKLSDLNSRISSDNDRINSLISRTGATRFVSMADIETNPFAYSGMRVAAYGIFSRMLREGTALIQLDSDSVVVNNFSPDFTEATPILFVLEGLDKAEFKNALGGVTSKTTGNYVEHIACDAKCVLALENMLF